MMRIVRRYYVLEASTVAELARLNAEAPKNMRWEPKEGAKPGYQLLACLEVATNPAAPKAKTPQRKTATKATSSKPAAKESKGVPPVVQAANDSVAKAKEKATTQAAAPKANKKGTKATRPKK